MVFSESPPAGHRKDSPLQSLGHIPGSLDSSSRSAQASYSLAQALAPDHTHCS